MIYNITPNDKLNSVLEKALENKAGKQTVDGGFQAGTDASCEGPGGAIGLEAYATSGGAIGMNAYTLSGAAIGMNASSGAGAAIGAEAKAGVSSIAIGFMTEAKDPTNSNFSTITIGRFANAGGSDTSAIAIGQNANAEQGIAIGDEAKAKKGIAIGDKAIIDTSSNAIGDGTDSSEVYGIQLGKGQYASQGEGEKMIDGFQVYNYPLMYGNGYIPAARQYVSGIYYIYSWDGNIAQIYEDKAGQIGPYKFNPEADIEISLYLDEVASETEQIKLVEVWSELNLIGVGNQLKAFGLADPSTMLDNAYTIPIMIKEVLK